jgi:hypothetical protein
MGGLMPESWRRPRHSARSAAALLALALALAAWHPCRARAADSAVIVEPKPASGPALSYFKLAVASGRRTQAGTIGLRNPSSGTIQVALVPVNGQTLSTLGSTYAPPNTRARGATRWLSVTSRRVTLAAHESATVPVAVSVPQRSRPGDYLAGVSVEQLGQAAEAASRGVSIASTVRYAIGVEVTVPGRRKAAIRFTGARVRREPAGLTFLLDARNTGNVILQRVHGSSQIRRGHRVVARLALGPGTFVSGTSIAYPVHAFAEHPVAGTRYRVTAVLRYAGGIARLDTTVTFGRRQAAVQRSYAHAGGGGGGTAWWKIALLAAAILYGLTVTALLLRRRSRPAANP